MFKLTTTNSVWKSSLFRPISYQISRTDISNRGLVRFLKAKRAKLRVRWAQQKADRQAGIGLEVIPTPKDLEISVTPDIPRHTHTFLDSPDTFFDKDQLQANIKKNLRINDLGAFLGYRSGFQKQHFARVLEALLLNQQLNVQEVEEKLISFIKLAKTLKLYDLFNRDHFEFMLANGMIASLNSMLELQKDSTYNFFTPDLAATLIEFVAENPIAFFLLQNLKYCSVVTEGVRPTKDTAKIDQKLMYYIFDPKTMKTNDILPIAHSIMFIFPETFLRVFNVQGLFFKEMLGVSISNRKNEDLENRKYPNLGPEVYDQNQMRLRHFVQESKNYDLEKYQDAKKLIQFEKELLIEYDLPTASLVEMFGNTQEKPQSRIDRLYRTNRITKQQKEQMQEDQKPVILKLQNQKPAFLKTKQDNLILDSRRFDPAGINYRIQQLLQNDNLTRKEQEDGASRILWDQMGFENQREQSEIQKQTQLLNEKFKLDSKIENFIQNKLIETITNEDYEAAKELMKKDLKDMQQAFQQDQQEYIDHITMLDIPDLMVEAIKDNVQKQRYLKKFRQKNPDTDGIVFSEEDILSKKIQSEEDTNVLKGNNKSNNNDGEGIQNAEVGQQDIESQENIELQENIENPKQQYKQSQWGNAQNQKYDVTQAPKKSIQNPKQKKFKQVKVVEVSTQQLITEELEEIEEDPNQISDQSMLSQQDPQLQKLKNALRYQEDPQGQYKFNHDLEQMLWKYAGQHQSIVRFLAEAFFNTPDFEHGIKSVNLFYLILYRLTYYAENITPENQMNIKDLLALATNNSYYQELFTYKLSDILHNYHINRVNIGDIFDKLVESYSFNDSMLFEPVIVTEQDRDFYTPNKAISYGKFDSDVQYKALPQQYLTRKEAFQSEEVKTRTVQNQGQIKDIVDSYNQKRTQGGYSYETINLMDSVLSKSSNGMYNLFKNTLNQYPNYQGQFNDRVQTLNTQGLNKEQLSLFGLTQMTDILYGKSTPTRDSQMLDAVYYKNIRENIPVDAILKINEQIQQNENSKEYDFFVPEYEKYGQKLKHKIVDDYVPELSDLNRTMIFEDLRKTGRLQFDNTAGEELREKRDGELYRKQFDKMMEQHQKYLTPEEREQINKEISTKKAPLDKRRQQKRAEKKKQWHEDNIRYQRIREEAFDLVDENFQGIKRRADGSMDINATFNQIHKQFIEQQEEIYSSEELQTWDSALDDIPNQQIEKVIKLQKNKQNTPVIHHIKEQKKLQEKEQIEEKQQKKFKKPVHKQSKEQKEQKKFVSKQEKERRDHKLEQKEAQLKKLKKSQKQVQTKAPSQIKHRFKPRDEEDKYITEDYQQQLSAIQIRQINRENKDQQWYGRNDDSIMDILEGRDIDDQNTYKTPKGIHFRADDPFDDQVEPDTPQREQTKHDKRAAHEARKHFKRRDTEPDLTHKEKRQAMPFRRDKQKNLDDDKIPPRNNFSTMKPKFKFSTIKKQVSSISQHVNTASSLEEACTEIKNIFRRNNNNETLKELMRIPELSYFKTGSQCALAMFFYYEGLPLAESNSLKGNFHTSMGEVQVDYNKYLKTTLFDFELGDTIYTKFLEHLKVNFNRNSFKKVMAHIVRYSDMISFQLATEIADFVTETNVPITQLEFVNLLTANEISLNLNTLMVLLSPLSNYAETSRDVYTLYKANMLRLGWPISLFPLQNYIIKLNKAGETAFVSQMVQDLRSIILSKKFKLSDKNASSEDSKRLQNEFKQELKAQQLKYVIETANVLGFTGCFEKAEQMFDQYKSQTKSLSKEELKTGFYCYTMNQQKLQELFDILAKNKEYITVDTYVRVLQPIKKSLRNKQFLDKVLEMFIYSGAIQKYLTALEINQTIQAFIRSKNTNSYPRLLEHLLKYELKLDENSQRLFYNVIKEAHTTSDSKRMIVNLLDIIFNKDRQNERKQYILKREREEEKKRKLEEMKENQLKRIRSNLQELQKLTSQTNTNSTKQATDVTPKAQKIQEIKTQNQKVQIKTAEPQAPPAEVQEPQVKQSKKGAKQQKSKKKDKKAKDQEKLARVMKKQDQKARSKLYQQDAPQNKRKQIIPQQLRLAVTPKQMRRGGRRKFFFLAMTQQQIQDDEAARQAIKMKKRRQ